ncbi:FkbM family methyltransferase [Pedobacter panaciterrae]|uniref:FkbM family methyltransferase n=1 Tax=Pedobacter panaciterrae TaxID=363849 RepID=UPI002595C027|nr:FkbM family methyltransferase [uncultured Pedobacter sp.]
MLPRLENTLSKLLTLNEEDQNHILDMIEQSIAFKEKMNTTDNPEINGLFRMAEFAAFNRSIIGPYVKLLMVNTYNGLFVVKPDDCVVGHALRMEGKYGDQELTTIKKFINSESEVLIVGAHIGSLAIPVSNIAFKTVAIEANPETFELLQMNIKFNRVDRCEAFNIAANDTYEDLRFLVNTVNSGGSKRKPIIEDVMYTYDEPSEITVKSAPLDDYLQGRKFDVVVMDLEGSEYFALRGMQNILSHAKVLIIEFIPHHLKNVSGVSLDDFLGTLHGFKSLTVPSLNIKVPFEQSKSTLNDMYMNNLSDDGIIFEK